MNDIKTALDNTVAVFGTVTHHTDNWCNHHPTEYWFTKIGNRRLCRDCTDNWCDQCDRLNEELDRGLQLIREWNTHVLKNQTQHHTDMGKYGKPNQGAFDDNP